MVHKQRVWSVADLGPDVRAAATQLKESGSWCSCTGWRYEGQLWLNDSFADAGGEYGVALLTEEQKALPLDQLLAIRPLSVYCFESVTVAWCDVDALIRYLTEYTEDRATILGGRYAGIGPGGWTTAKVEPVKGHHCQHCA